MSDAETVDNESLRIYAVQTFARFLLSDGRIATIQMPLEELPVAYDRPTALAESMIEQHGLRIRETLAKGGLKILDEAGTQEVDDG